MRSVVCRILHSRGATSKLSIAQYIWVMCILCVLAALEANKIGLFLVPSFGATPTILLVLPEVAIAQPYALIAGSVTGAGVGLC